MLNEQLEFSISQYVDGNLSTEEQAALETALSSNGEARELLGQYRRLASMLRTTPVAIPNLDWNEVSDRISSAIEHDEREGLYLPAAQTSLRWRVRARVMAAAAAVVIVSGVAALLFQQKPHGTNTASTPVSNVPAVQVAVVSGPQPDKLPAARTIVSDIGPATSVDGTDARLADSSIVNRSSRVVWIASGDNTVQDREPMPY